MNKKWTNGVAPMRVSPDAKARLLMNIPERAVVKTSDEITNGFEKVWYTDSEKETMGWVYVGWLEAYEENYPKNCVDIPDQTVDPRDAEQYFILNGIKQTNICGEACAAFILGKPLKEVLTQWQRAEPEIWKSVLSSGKLRGTGYGELMTIFTTFQRPALSLTEMLTNPVIGRPRYTPFTLQYILNGGQVIAGVNIDNAGRLKPSGIPHWIVVTAVHPERAGYGTLELYNPFPNRVEVYSWNEFALSARVPTGVYVPGVSV